jgi:formylglycine-generating enzyme required for sulfatase activity
MDDTPDPTSIASIRAANVAVGGPQTIIADGMPIAVPTRADLLTYLANVQAAYRRWADAPDDAADAELDDAPSSEQAEESTQDRFIEMRALPMRLAQYRPQPTDGDAPSVELLAAVQNAQRTIILGEPGSGKSAALERLAWVTATNTLQRAQVEPNAPLLLPLLARLADYRGEADLTPVLRRALNSLGPWRLGDSSVRLLLWASNVRIMLLLDGLNELERAHLEAGRRALRGHLSDYRQHAVHLTCRSADFDAAQEADPELQVLPGAALWTVQELLDAIDHWDDAGGASDVRDYLRFHLGEANGRRLYAHLRNDERLAGMARIPLFLWMFKQAAGDGRGELPNDRGELLAGFVQAPRVLGRVPKPDRSVVERSLECVGWRLQQAGVLQGGADALYDALEQARGRHSQPLDALRDHLKRAGLLLDISDAREDRYRLLHQLLQEYAAAAHLLRSGQTGAQLPHLAQNQWWRETCILALWLDKTLHTPAYLFALMGDASIDLRVRVAAATILGEVGDPRFVRRSYAGGVQAIEPAMVEIPAGLALLGGDDPEADDDEQPQCQVQVLAFALAVHPVTNAEFACFVEAGGYDDPTLWTLGGQAWLRGESTLDAETEQDLRQFFRSFSRDVEAWIARTKQAQALDDALADNYRAIAANYSEDEYVEAYSQQILGEQRREPYYWRDSRFNRANQPVVGVNWYEAMAYAAWLSQVTGQAYRLPSEAEWEWAAHRASTGSGSARRYPWGDDWDGNHCNWRGSALNRPNPVGVYAHAASADGLQELAGNVFEWTRSLYRPYPYQPEDGREALDVEGLRVVRGGSWYIDKDRVRCACRGRTFRGSGTITTDFASPGSLSRLLSFVRCPLSAGMWAGEERWFVARYGSLCNAARRADRFFCGISITELSPPIEIGVVLYFG